MFQVQWPSLAALSCAIGAAPCLHAQGVATDADLAPVVVTGQARRTPLPPGMTAATATQSAEQLRQQNLVNPEDALQYAPNTTIRKRYIGDRNALIGGRSFGTAQPSRALVYLDGYLISNFLGRFDAPRWNMISPEAIERVDVLYGPYSALLPGNSIGTTVAVTQRVPKGLEASGRLIGHQQRFNQYGQHDTLDGHQLSVHLGQRLDTGLWFTGDVNHQDATSQPMQYYTVSANAAGAFPATSGPAKAVSGIAYDVDPKGVRRAILGASGGATDHTVQDTVNLRAGYRFTPTLEASAMAAWWSNTTELRNRSFLQDAGGATVWSGVVTDGVNRFKVPDSAFAPATRQESHQQLGLTLKTRQASGWNQSLVASNYRIVHDAARQANHPEPVAAGGGDGSLTQRDGTGWTTWEWQGSWTPSPGDWTAGRHALAFGVHRNDYTLRNRVNTTLDWRNDAGSLSQFYGGRTQVWALYVQDAWRLRDDLKLTLGWREERFRALDGRQLASGTRIDYADRALQGHSPKASLAWSARDDLTVSLSAGRGVRFPNVEELYNGTITATSQTLPDPKLKPETSDAIELSADQRWDRQRLRVSLFHDQVSHAIARPTVFNGSRTNTYVLNVDRVDTTGIELVWQTQDVVFSGLDLDASATLTRSKVVANARDPSLVGQWWLRVPRARATLQASYRPDQNWRLSAGWRYQGRAYNETDNSDTHPDVYGGVSSLRQLDLRASRKLSLQLELALGINNVLDAHAYQYHPLPGRTLFAELRFNH